MRHSSMLVLAAGIALAGFRALSDQSAVENADRPPRGGAQLYVRYCAACHGVDGRGHGPKASMLTPSPSDLTTIAKDNFGAFPRATIEDLLMNGGKWKGQGSKGMPVFGPILREERSPSTNPAITNENLAIARIKNIVTYLESIQGK